jgi:hypothetical protein
MSEENIDLVRRGIEAALRRPKPDFAALDALYHPDHEFVSVVDFTLEGGSHRGMSGYRDWLLGIEETIQSRSRLEQVTGDRRGAGSSHNAHPSRGQIERHSIRRGKVGVHRDREGREDHPHRGLLFA